MEMDKKVKVLIVDDHEAIRKQYTDTIQGEENFIVIAEAENAQEGYDKITKLKPDIAVIDIDLPPGNNGLELSKVIKKEIPETEIIIMTGYDKDEGYFSEAMDIDVSGYVTKDKIFELITAINTVIEGGNYISPKVHKFLKNRYEKRKTILDDIPGLNTLTEREIDVIKLVSENKPNKEIGEILFIEERTVETHRKNICKKLNLKGRNALLSFAIQNKHLI
ncbi:MAG: DNA-binding response regulator [Ignavibacteriae bacterium]|nr:MAG: DNA-binding response regulator [Ignavibacteriota bacterium]